MRNCARDGSAPEISIDTQNHGVTKIQCPTCNQMLIEDTCQKAIEHWDYDNRPEWKIITWIRSIFSN